MKFKLIFSVCLLFLFTSCKVIRLTSAENLKPKSAIANFSFRDNQIFLPIIIDGKSKEFLFDTGATNTCVLDTLLIENYTKKEKLSLFSTTVGDGQKMTFKSVPTTIETNLYEFKNQLVTIIPSKNFEGYCNKSLLAGIIGSSFFTKDTAKIAKLNFDNSSIEILKPNVNIIQSYSDYKEVKSKFFRSHFTIFLKIDGVEEPFLFDTGNGASPILIGKKSNIKIEHGIEYLGSSFVSAGGIAKEGSLFYDNIEVVLGDNSIKSSLSITSMVKSKYNNVGLDFIKKFNWIIDFKNKKVFTKTNKVVYENESIIPKYKYLALINSNKIIIVSKLKSEIKYNLGDEIISVNNQKITNENICEISNLLNKTLDWSILNLVVKPTIFK